MNIFKIILTCLVSILAVTCSPSDTAADCKAKLDSLYEQYDKHLIFYIFYEDSINRITGADTVFENYLPWYREEAGLKDLHYKDSVVLQRLSTRACNNESGFWQKMNDWCSTSVRLGAARDQDKFTLEGYMDFLLTDSNTKVLLDNYITGERTVSSLSTEEMERICFASVTRLIQLPADYRELFFHRLGRWRFVSGE